VMDRPVDHGLIHSTSGSQPTEHYSGIMGSTTHYYMKSIYVETHARDALFATLILSPMQTESKAHSAASSEVFRTDSLLSRGHIFRILCAGLVSLAYFARSSGDLSCISMQC